MASRAAALRRAERTGAWKSTLAVVVTIAAALLGLSPLLQGLGWWVATVVFAVLLLTVMAVLRGRGAPEAVVVAVGAIVWGGLVIVLFAGDTLWFGLPTLGTLSEISGDLATARQSIAEQEVPAVADPAITQLIVMSVGLIAIITDELATGLRVPAVSGIGPLAVLAIAPLVRQNDPDVAVYLVTALGYLAVLWFSSRIGRAGARAPASARSIAAPPRRAGRNPGLALGLAAAAVTAMVALPLITPGLTEESLADDDTGGRFPTVYATGVDPTIQLGRDLRRSSPVLSLTYTTSAEEGLYLKMVNLSDFSTGTWDPEYPYDAEGYDDGAPFGTPPGLAADVPTVDTTTTVSIAALRSDWLPLPYPTQSVDSLPSDSWLLTPETFTVTDLAGDTRGLNYTVNGLTIQPTPGQLAEAGAIVPDSLGSYLSVPEDMPPVIAATAAEVASGAATNYDRAVALQEYFRGGQFTYSLNAPDSGAYDGDNVQMIAAFLEAKEGYCVHYAASMAVMARTLGIPSRIAVGYAPGQSPDSTSEGRPVYEVFTDQLHSWPELYFDGIGWLPFEPTPGLDFTPPDYSLPDYAQSAAGSAADVPLPSATSSADPGQERPDSGDAAGSQSAEQQALAQLRGWGTFAAVLGAIAAVLFAPWAVRALRRRSRLRRLGSDALPATLAWTEFEDTLDDLRMQRSAGETPAELEQRLLADMTLPQAALERLRLAVEVEQFARPVGAPDAEPAGGDGPTAADTAARARIRTDLEALVAGIDGQASPRDRTLARLLPASLWRRRSGRPAAAAGALVP